MRSFVVKKQSLSAKVFLIRMECLHQPSAPVKKDIPPPKFEDEGFASTI